MAITAAQVEANGWVLRLTLSAALASVDTAPAHDTPATWAANFAGYALAPNSAAPALRLAGTTSGFVQSAGIAVASTAVARSLVATKVLKKPVESGTAAGTRKPKRPDETDNGDGTITVRIALSQHVYQGDAALVLTALAGWRTGEAAQTIGVANNSTVAAPAPIVRWADVPYKRKTGPFALEVAVAGHHPSGVQPVAGVRFTVTDGTTVKSYWATALSASAYGAGGATGTGIAPRVYAVTVDPTTATALTQGLLRCDFEVYPWIGPAQKSDAAGTRDMTNLGTSGLSQGALVPFVVAWDPAGTWLVPRYAYVSAGGATSAAAANVSTSAAAAAATPLATINLAIESLRLWAVANPAAGGTVAAANGQAAITQSVDGNRIRLAAGVTSGVGASAVTAGVQTLASWLVVEGDPADANPLADCILRAPAAAGGGSRVTRVRFSNLSVEANTVGVFAAAWIWLDAMELRAVTGAETATAVPLGAANGGLWTTGVKWWKYGLGITLSGTTQRPILARGCDVERSIGACVALGNRRLPSAIAGTQGYASEGSWAAPSTDPLRALERLCIGNDFRYLNGAGANFPATLANASAPAGVTLGQTWPVVSRFAFVGNVAEVYGAAAPLWSSLGENNPVVSSEWIIEGNTYTGDRTNNPYGDLNLATVALNDTADNLIRVHRFANNVTLKNASKHDAFNDPTVAAQRIGVAPTATRSKAYTVGAQVVIAGSPANIYQCTTAGTTAATGGPSGTGASIADGSVVWQWVASESRQHGYRPQAIGAWSSAYGVGYEGNIDLQAADDPNADPEFRFEFYGLGSNQLSAEGVTGVTDPFTLDKSGTVNKQNFQATPDGTGGGNYKPLTSGSGTYLLGRARSANVDTDQRGVARAIPFAAGGIEGSSATALAPASAAQAMRAASPAVGWSATIVPARAVQPSRAGAGHVGWSATLSPAAARQPSAAKPGLVGLAIGLAAAGARSGQHATGPIVAWRGNLSPGGTHAAMRVSGGLVSVDGGVPVAVTVDFGRIAIVDRLLPAPNVTPASRTLVVDGDCRTPRIN